MFSVTWVSAGSTAFDEQWVGLPKCKSHRGVASSFGHMTKNRFLPLQVVGVADPRKFAQTKLQRQHQIVNNNIFEGQQTMAMGNVHS